MEEKEIELEIKSYLSCLSNEILLDDYYENKKDFDLLTEQYVLEELETGGEIAEFIKESEKNKALVYDIYYRQLSLIINSIKPK